MALIKRSDKENKNNQIFSQWKNNLLQEVGLHLYVPMHLRNQLRPYDENHEDSFEILSSKEEWVNEVDVDRMIQKNYLKGLDEEIHRYQTIKSYREAWLNIHPSSAQQEDWDCLQALRPDLAEWSEKNENKLKKKNKVLIEKELNLLTEPFPEETQEVLRGLLISIWSPKRLGWYEAWRGENGLKRVSDNVALVGRALLAHEHHSTVPFEAKNVNRSHVSGVLMWMPWRYENQEVERNFKTWIQEMEHYEFIWGADYNEFYESYPQELRDQLQTWIDTPVQNFNRKETLPELREVTQDSLTQWKAQAIEKRIRHFFDHHILMGIMKREGDNVVFLGDFQKKIVKRFRCLKVEGLKGLDQRKASPFGVDLPKIQSGDLFKSWLGMTMEHWFVWAQVFGEEWFMEPPEGIREEEWTQELVDNKLREWEQYVVIDASMNAEQRLHWIAQYDQLSGCATRMSQDPMGKSVLNEKEIKSRRIEHIENELWLSLVSRFLNGEVVDQKFKPGERQERVSQLRGGELIGGFRAGVVSKAGWKKMQNQPSFAWVFLKKVLTLDQMESMKSQIKVWAHEEWLKESSKGDKKWSGLGSDPLRVQKDPRDWDVKDKERSLDDVVLSNAKKIEVVQARELKDLEYRWIMNVMTMASEYHWSDHEAEVVMEWGLSLDLREIYQAQVNPMLMWGDESDYELLTEAMQKELAAKEVKVRKWLNGWVDELRHIEKDSKRKEIRSFNSVLKGVSRKKGVKKLSQDWADLKDVQHENPFDFFCFLDAKDPYQDGKRKHQDMVNRLTRLKTEKMNKNQYPNDWIELQCNPWLRDAVRQWVKKESLIKKSNETENKAILVKKIKDLQQEINVHKGIQNDPIWIEIDDSNVDKGLKEKRKEDLALMRPVEVEVLNSEHLLSMEGQRMHHCVGGNSYYEKVKKGSAIILHLHNKNTDAMSTLMFERHQQGWVESQHRGKYNATVSDPGVLAVSKDIHQNLRVLNIFKQMKWDVTLSELKDGYKKTETKEGESTPINAKIRL